MGQKNVTLDNIGNTTKRCFPFLGKFKVTSPFGTRSAVKTSEGYSSTDHKGIDLVGLDDKTIVSCCDGIVTRAQYGNGVGNYVWVKSDEGYGMIYQHLASIAVKVGQRVTCKQKIGVMGNTGNSSGPHLHFGVASNGTFTSYYQNKWFNPAIYWNITNPGSVNGKTFNGSGMITGYAAGVTSTNNNQQNIANSSYRQSDSLQQSMNQGYLDVIYGSGESYGVVDLKGTLGDWLYGRRYRVFVDIGRGKSLDVSELRCKFSITKDMTSLAANQSTVMIYNLNPDDENLLIKEGQRIIIEAGYEGSQYGMIFCGNIIQPLRSKENGVDYCLTLVSMDADRYATYGLIGVSLTAQQTARDAVDAVLTKSSQQIGRGFLTQTGIRYPRGKVMFGMSRDYLSQIAKSENSAFYIEDGQVNIVSPPDVGKGEILSFNPQTGLINSPVQNNMGIQCSVLLNPQLKLNSLFHVDNTKIQNMQYTMGEAVRSLDKEGIYRVIKLTHHGDTRGNEWYTDVGAISQSGGLPNYMSGSSLYPW